MSLALLLTLYITLNLLLVMAYFGLKVIFSGEQNFSYQTQLKWHYTLLSLVLFITILHPFIPAKQVFTPTAKVWTAKSIKSFSSDYEVLDKGGYIKVDVLGSEKTFDGSHVLNASALIFIPLFFIVSALLLKDLYQLSLIRKSSYFYRRYKNVQILLNDAIQVPFSYMFFKNAYVVIPTRMIENPEHFQVALFHELQHHRQGDTKWVYMIWFFRLLCFFNPVIHLMNRDISNLQEFSCDEILIGHNKVSAQSYAHCLIAVAQNSLLKMKAPLCATGLTFLTAEHLLKRRIKMMYSPQSRKLSLMAQSILMTAFLLVFTSVAYAAKSFVQDKRVSMKEAQILVQKSSTGIPLELNDLVLKEINRFVGTPEGREFFKASLKRMKLYEAMISEKLIQGNLPLELLAVPIVESGYQNLPQANNQGWGAGLWMFIKSTARVYGLRVDETVDERLDPMLLTDAAVKYFQSNYALFNDWHLSVLAYNLGENNVKKAMNELNTKDAWTIIRSGRENDKAYLPRVIAAMIILKNPSLLD